MFRLPPVKLWRVLALVWAAASVAASGVVTVCSAGPVSIHWGSGGVPNGFAEPWMLWGLSRHEAFRNKKMLLPVDAGMSAQGERELGLLFIRPGFYSSEISPLEEFLNFQKEMNLRMNDIRLGRGESHEFLSLCICGHRRQIRSYLQAVRRFVLHFPELMALPETDGSPGRMGQGALMLFCRFSGFRWKIRLYGCDFLCICFENSVRCAAALRCCKAAVPVLSSRHAGRFFSGTVIPGTHP